jgi:hypothetical protein
LKANDPRRIRFLFRPRQPLYVIGEWKKKFAVPEEILGLAETLSGQPCEAGAEAAQPTQTGFVELDNLVALMRRHNELAVRVAMQLGQSYCSVIAGVRTTILSRSTPQKLARFVLDWYESNHPLVDEYVAPFTLTHEEIALEVRKRPLHEFCRGSRRRG